MPEPNEIAKPQETDEVTSLLDGGDVDGDKGKTAEEIAAEKESQAAEEKRILEADPATLSEQDKATRASLEKTKEEKRLLETSDDKLNEEEKQKKAALVKAKDDAAKAKQGAPEAYAEFKVPDGIEVNTPMLEEFKTVAKELNLNQEAAQKLVDLQVKYTQQISDGLLKNFNETITGWKKETIQELGADYKKELVHAGRAIEQFGTPELRVILKNTGVGNHKELVKFFVKVGKAVADDTFVHGQDKGGKKSDAELFYGDSMK